MNIKRIQPLHTLLHMIGTPLGRHQMLVGNQPPHARHDHSKSQPVNQNTLDDKSHDGREGWYAECEAVGDAGREYHDDLEEAERGVVPRPVIFGLFSVVRHFVDSLGVER